MPACPRRLPLVLSLLFGARFLAAAPPSPPTLAAGVRAAVEVTAMDLDVVATKDGRPVNDLTKSELVVRVDGKPVSIDFFARIEAGTVHGPDLSTASPDLVLDTLKADSGETYVPRQFLVYFDDDRLLPPERVAILEEGALIDEVNLFDRRERYRLRPTVVDRAVQLLDGAPFIKHVTVRGHEVVFIPTNADGLGQVTQRLAEGGVGVLEMNRDVFDLRGYYRERVSAERARRTGVVDLPSVPTFPGES